MANLTMFRILAVVILGSVIMCVPAKRITWATTLLIFTLSGVASIYFLLGCTYLGVAQITIYIGGIAILYILAVQLVSRRAFQGLVEHFKDSRVTQGTLLPLIGLTIMIGVLVRNQFIYQAARVVDAEVPMNAIGQALVGSEKYQYVLPLELISMSLSVRTIGGLLIARKEDDK